MPSSVHSYPDLVPGVTSTASSAEVPKLGFEPSSIGCTKTALLHPQVPEIISIHYDGSSSNLTVVTRYFVSTDLSQNFLPFLQNQ